ncbi:hypothetical protein SLA2020_199620 [Shorea laevis]
MQSYSGLGPVLSPFGISNSRSNNSKPKRHHFTLPNLSCFTRSLLQKKATEFKDSSHFLLSRLHSFPKY